MEKKIVLCTTDAGAYLIVDEEVKEQQLAEENYGKLDPDRYYAVEYTTCDGNCAHCKYVGAVCLAREDN